MGSILGYIGLRDNGKYNGNYCTIVYWGLYRENGKENGGYYLGFRV